MDYYHLKILGMERDLPIIFLGPKIKIASFNLVGDRKLINLAARAIALKIRKLEFNYLIGPELKVVPLIHEVSNYLKKERYMVCRKSIKAYMINPVSSDTKPLLVLDGTDAVRLKNKKVVIIDDVISTGRTIRSLKNIMQKVGSEVLATVTVLKQGESSEESELKDLIFLQKLPTFKNYS